MPPDVATAFVFEAGGPHDLHAPLDGYYFFEKDTIYIPVVMTWPEFQGKGYVGRLIDAAKEQAAEVVFPTVLSQKLAWMLDRRGFEPEVRDFDGAGEPVDCYVWRACANPSKGGSE